MAELPAGRAQPKLILSLEMGINVNTTEGRRLTPATISCSVAPPFPLTATTFWPVPRYVRLRQTTRILGLVAVSCSPFQSPYCRRIVNPL